MEAAIPREVNLTGGNLNKGPKPDSKLKIVVIMGATGSGKSKLAVDLASHFPIEIISADSTQVYQGLDVLINKVPQHEQKGVPHHLLGTISSNVEFTAKDFRDSAIPNRISRFDFMVSDGLLGEVRDIIRVLEFGNSRIS